MLLTEALLVLDAELVEELLEDSLWAKAGKALSASAPTIESERKRRVIRKKGKNEAKAFYQNHV